MLAKRLLHNLTKPSSSSAQNVNLHNLSQAEFDVRITLHYGIPSTASVLAFDPIQKLMAIGTLDGRIKVIGGDNIEGLFMSPKQLPYKNMEFLHNKGFLVSISNGNDIEVWDLEHRRMACCLKWEMNITAFTVIQGTYFMYLGDEYGLMSVLKYDSEEGKLLQLPYHIPANSLAEAAGVSVANPLSIVGVITQPCASENRVLIAYENGLIVLWDVFESRVLQVRGYKDLQLRDRMVVDSSSGVRSEIIDHTSDEGIEGKEISSLCWASSSGSILAVGYVDGDIMLWNMSSTLSTKDQQAGISSSDVVKLQLSSSNRRLPVIVLHWCANGRSPNETCGRLFIYGGDEIGSEEVLTILSLKCSSGVDTLQCLSRVDLTLNGSFADMIVTPNDGTKGNSLYDTLFVLANPGQLLVYDDATLSALSSEEKKASISTMQFPVALPTVDPNMTVALLSLVPEGDNSWNKLLEIASLSHMAVKPTMNVGIKWPLTGGVRSHLCLPPENGIKRVYLAGYQDGSVRVWDATHPSLSLILIVEGEVQNIKVSGASASVSALEFCPLTISLAVGNECGLVRVYKLGKRSDEMSFHFVTESNHEVHSMHLEKGLQCVAVFSVLDSPVRTLQFTNSGTKLALGFESGSVGMIDMSSLSILFLTDSVSGSGSPVISVTEKALSDIRNSINSQNHEDSRCTKDPVDALLILTRDSHIVIVDDVTGDRISSRLVQQKKESSAISMHIIESNITTSVMPNENKIKQSPKNSPAENEPLQTNDREGISQEVDLHSSSETIISGERESDSLILLCCEDALHLFSLKSILKGDTDSIRKVNLVEACSWSTTFKNKDEKVCGVVLLYRTGVIEIRSLPDLEVVEETSLMSTLRWSFKANMDKTICSTDSGHLILVNGREVAFLSILAAENDFRIPDSLPCLHDKDLAAAVVVANNFSSNLKKKEVTAPGILGGIIKGFKGEKVQNDGHLTENSQSNATQHLESIFSRDPFSDPSETLTDDPKVIELNIDDIDIDELVSTASTSYKGKSSKKDKKNERLELFEGAATAAKPKQRTAAEVMAKYRKAGDASAAASQARDKLVERQEKLERLSRRTEELQSGAENFASMANELVKTMEAKKWWNI